MHTTNYFNTFIRISDDCPNREGAVPTSGKAAGIAELQFERLFEHPYSYTSDELLLEIHMLRNGIPPGEKEEAGEVFFSKGQACLRSSPLAKRHGWGFHFDGSGRVAVFAAGSEEYERLSNHPDLKQVMAMRNKRA